MCGFFPHTNKQLWCQLDVLQFNSVLTLSTWTQHQIPRLQLRLSPTRLPPNTHTSDANHKARLLPVLLTINKKFPWPPPRFCLMLEELTELRETFSLLDYQFNIKGYTATWKRCIGQGRGKGCRASMLWVCHLSALPHVHQHGSSPNPFFLGCLWSFHYIAMID